MNIIKYVAKSRLKRSRAQNLHFAAAFGGVTHHLSDGETT